MQLIKVIMKQCANRKVNKFGARSIQKALTKTLKMANKSKRSKSRSRKRSRSKGSKRKNCPKGSRRVGRICKNTADLAFLKVKKAQGMSHKDAMQALKEAKMKAVAAAMGVAAPAVAAPAAKKSAGAAAKKGRSVDPFKGLSDADKSALFVKLQGQKAMDNLQAWKNRNWAAAPKKSAGAAAKKGPAAPAPTATAAKTINAGLQKYNDAINAIKAKGHTHEEAKAIYKNQKMGRETQRGSPPKKVRFASELASSAPSRSATPAATPAARPYNFPEFKGIRTIFE